MAGSHHGFQLQAISGRTVAPNVEPLRFLTPEVLAGVALFALVLGGNSFAPILSNLGLGP